MDRALQRRFDVMVGFVISFAILAFTRIVPEAFDLTKAVVALVAAPVLLFVGNFRSNSFPQIGRRDPVRIVLLIASFAFFVSALRNPNLHLGIAGQEHRFTGLLLWLAGLLAAWVVYSRSTDATSERVLRAVFLASIPFILYGALQAFDVDPFEWSISSFGRDVVFSTQGNPNFASWTTVIVLAASLHVLLTTSTRWIRLCASLVAAGGLWISIETRSVQGLAGISVLGLVHVMISTFSPSLSGRMPRLFSGCILLVSPVILYFQSGSEVRNLLISLGIGVLLFASSLTKIQISVATVKRLFLGVVVASSLGVVASRSRLVDELGAQSGERTAFYQAGWRMFESNPLFGVGLERYGRLFPFYRPSWHAERLENSLSGSAHSIWLAFAVWGGFLLLLPMLAFATISIARGLKTVRTEMANPGRVDVVALTISLVLCWLISAESATVVFVTLIFMGLCAAPVGRKSSKVSSSWRNVSLATSVVLLCVVTFVGARWMIGNKAQNDAYRELFGNQNIEEGLRLLDRGVAWSPVSSEARATRANVMSQLGIKERAVADALKFVEEYEYTGPGVLASAQILIQFGETESARYVLEKGIERNPGSQSLQSQAAALLESLPPK
jgi:hypothetical protein